MRTKDLIKMCLQNLKRRRGRTLLTVSGVVIGCCSIVIMLSIGIGMKESQERMLQEMGDLTTITVLPAGGSQKDRAKLDTAMVEAASGLMHVTLAAPKAALSLEDLQITVGKDDRYLAEGITVIGIPDEAFEKIGYKLLEGRFPGGKSYEAIIGKEFAFTFQDKKRPEGKNMVDYWSNPDAKPFVNVFREKVQIVKGAKESTPSFGGGMPGEENGGQNATETKRQVLAQLSIVGKVEDDFGKGEETVYGIIMRLRDLQSLQKDIAKISGKKVSKEYTQVIVQVDDIGHVAQVEETLQGMGYQTSSMESIRKPMEKEARQKQLMLGGLGAISLFVAAIGIANTMIMSITERTKEIGIMKSLGCYVTDIRREFLLEAGMIGLMGGTVGSIISMGISLGMNLSAQEGSPLSVIPLWLIGFAIVFSVFMGIAAGYYPANKAVKVSALEAMRY